MEQPGISQIQPIREAQTADELGPLAQLPRTRQQEQVNLHMPWPTQLDLGSGAKAYAYAEYTGHEAVDRVSIKIIDPATGAVVRELPSEELLSFAEELTRYAELGRRYTRSL